jgi:hypothetical protein
VNVFPDVLSFLPLDFYRLQLLAPGREEFRLVMCQPVEFFFHSATSVTSTWSSSGSPAILRSLKPSKSRTFSPSAFQAFILMTVPSDIFLWFLLVRRYLLPGTLSVLKKPCIHSFVSMPFVFLCFLSLIM